jgi:uncharacterized membrane protein YhaH (DUF805 family)
MEFPYTNTEEMFAAAGPAVVIMVALFLLALSVAILIIKAVVYCKIFHKAGYNWALGLLMLVPIASIIMPFVLAFGHWPIIRELRELRRQLKSIST